MIDDLHYLNNKKRELIPSLLKKQTEAFEANFLKVELQDCFSMKDSFESINVNSLFQSSYAEKIYTDLLNQEYAKQIVKKNGIGIAKMLADEIIKKEKL